MQARLLGPVDVTVHGVPQPVAGVRRKAVLAVLALRAGEVVGSDRLIDVVWGDRAPATALNALQAHVSHLRGVLGDRAAIVGAPPGYVLQLPAPATDVVAAERLVQQARQAGDPAERAGHLRAALALRRGPALAEVDGLDWLDRQAARLERLLLDAELALADARLELGEHVQLVPELERLAEQHPWHEHVHGQLVRALYRSHRQAEALAIYERLRRVLDEELGIPPSPELRDLQAAVLRQDPALQPPAAAAAPVTLAPPGTPPPVTRSPDLLAPGPLAPALPVPAQLPLAVPVLAGRERELARLDALLPAAGRAAPVLLVTVSGTPGVGKTALAVHWAHRIAGRFPDGQLYVDLRGFDADGSGVDPADAARGFLDALGVPAERIPSGLAGQAALLRSVLAGRQVLLVLDNARDADQVRPLLPATSGCLAVVTSRTRLTSLVANEGACALALDLLSVDEARALLANRLGEDRIGMEPEAVNELVGRCARLPLALAVVAARAATAPTLSLGALAEQLRGAGAALDGLDGGDSAADVRAVLSWSYRALSPAAARLFRLLALHPARGICAPAAVSLAGAARREVRRALGELSGAHLLTELGAGRSGSHDLLRAYAEELLEETDSAGEQDAARHRLFDHYLHTAHAGALLMHPQFSRIELPPLSSGVDPQELADGPQAQVWFAAELPTLMDVAREAARTGYPVHAWQLSWVLAGYLERQGLWQDLLATASAALEVAVRAGDRTGQAHACRDLARVGSRLGRFTDALASARRARDLFAEVGDAVGEAHTHLTLGQLLERSGQLPAALEHSLRALELFGAAGHAPGAAYTLNAVGWQHALLGDAERALDYCGRGVVALHEVGDISGEADTWDSLGYAHSLAGDTAQAIACYRQALGLYEAVTDRFAEAATLERLGDSCGAAGDRAGAERAWRAALTILEELGHPSAAGPRGKLAGPP